MNNLLPILDLKKTLVINMDDRFINPLQSTETDFLDFVFLLQDCLHDEGLFSPDEISKVRIRLSMNNKNQIIRQRFLMFKEDICLVIDRNIHGGFGEDDYYRPQNELGPQHVLMVAYAPLMRQRDFLNGKNDLFRIQRFRKLGISYGTSYSEHFLYIDLPDNLCLLTKDLGSTKSCMNLLVQIVDFHIKTLQRICKGQTLREMSILNIATGIDSFKSEALNTYQTFYRNDTELQNFDPCADINEPVKMKDGSSLLFFDKTISTNCFSSSVKRSCPIPKKGTKFLFHTSGELGIRRLFSSSMSTPTQFRSDEAMSQMTHNYMRYLQLLQRDILKTSHIVEFSFA